MNWIQERWLKSNLRNHVLIIDLASHIVNGTGRALIELTENTVQMSMHRQILRGGVRINRPAGGNLGGMAGRSLRPGTWSGAVHPGERNHRAKQWHPRSRAEVERVGVDARQGRQRGDPAGSEDALPGAEDGFVNHCINPCCEK